MVSSQMVTVWSSSHLVPDAGYGGNDLRFAEALAERRDGDAHSVGEWVCVLVPGPGQELFGADDTALGGDEDFENSELLSGALYLLQLAVGGVREPHWHPTAWEANYVISGQAQWSVLSTHPQDKYLNCQFDVSAGDLVFIPAGYFHYFQNASATDPLLLLIAFNSSLPEPDDDIGIVGSVSAIPDAVLDLVFKVPAGTFAQIPKNFDPVVITQGTPPPPPVGELTNYYPRIKSGRKRCGC